MFDFTTMILAGAGGTAIAIAFIDYRFSKKRQSEKEKAATKG